MLSFGRRMSEKHELLNTRCIHQILRVTDGLRLGCSIWFAAIHYASRNHPLYDWTSSEIAVHEARGLKNYVSNTDECPCRDGERFIQKCAYKTISYSLSLDAKRRQMKTRWRQGRSSVPVLCIRSSMMAPAAKTATISFHPNLQERIRFRRLKIW